MTTDETVSLWNYHTGACISTLYLTLFSNIKGEIHKKDRPVCICYQGSLIDRIALLSAHDTSSSSGSSSNNSKNSVDPKFNRYIAIGYESGCVRYYKDRHNDVNNKACLIYTRPTTQPGPFTHPILHPPTHPSIHTNVHPTTPVEGHIRSPLGTRKVTWMLAHGAYLVICGTADGYILIQDLSVYHKLLINTPQSSVNDAITTTPTISSTDNPTLLSSSLYAVAAEPVFKIRPSATRQEVTRLVVASVVNSFISSGISACIQNTLLTVTQLSSKVPAVSPPATKIATDTEKDVTPATKNRDTHKNSKVVPKSPISSISRAGKGHVLFDLDTDSTERTGADKDGIGKSADSSVLRTSAKGKKSVKLRYTT